VSGAQSQIQAPSNSKSFSISASESKTESLKVLVLGQLQSWKEIIQQVKAEKNTTADDVFTGFGLTW